MHNSLKFRALLRVSSGPLVGLVTATLVAGVTPAQAAPRWNWPVTPHRITDTFRPPLHKWNAGHRGIDFAAKIGQDVFAVADGRVAFAGNLAGKDVIVISHGAIRTTYEPVRPQVFVGEHVKRADTIGQLMPGLSHCSKTLIVRCLHLGAIRGLTYVDPLPLIRGHVRLLPMGSNQVVVQNVDAEPNIMLAGAPARKRRAIARPKRVCTTVWLTNSHGQEFPGQLLCRHRLQLNELPQSDAVRAG